jgi:hypothetical protein
MAKINEVLAMLIPNGGYVVYGEDYEGIEFLECEPITKAQFTAGVAAFDAWKSNQDAQAAAAKVTAEGKLAALGLTSEDLKALGL